MENKKTQPFRLDPDQIELLDKEMVEVYRQKTPMERIKIASDMWDSAWMQISTMLRSIHPEWEEEVLKKEVIRRLTHNENL